MTLAHRDYTFLGTTQSLCPDCLSLVPAKIISRGARVYFRKACPVHGTREDFVCSDVAFYDRNEYSLPAKTPVQFGIEPSLGCPYDCGLCTEHEQHTCIGLVELTSSCNLTCPMCYASSGPGGKHTSLEDCKAAIDRLVEVEGRAEVLQLSGGEPTIHPEFASVLEYAYSRPIDYVMINTNGIRFAHDRDLVKLVSKYRDRLEVYFQFDGFSDRSSKALRGESLVKTKLEALDRLAEAGVNVTLVTTIQPDVNDNELGDIIRFGVERPYITGVSFQPATYSGRHVLPDELERRITFPDVIKRIATQTNGMFAVDDFLPLPCAHPNCHSLSIAWRKDGHVTPLTRFVDAKANLDLLANGISFTRENARRLLLQYLARQTCCSSGGCGSGSDSNSGLTLPVLGPESEFFTQAIGLQLGAANLFRITITSFLDVYNFDVRRVMKCCTHHVLPSGHVIPFCAYNVLYRPGHVRLPELSRSAVSLPR